MTAECPGCGAEAITAMWIGAQPVVLNYRFADPATARAVPRGDLDLVQCLRCGLVSNAAFSAALLPYDACYENSQSHSPAFRRYLDGLADILVNQHGLRGKRVLELGCGKGAFLTLLVERGDNAGDGYDTTWEDDGRPRDPRLRFTPERLTAAGVRTRYDAVVCRHVIEHVPDVRRFLGELAAIVEAAGDPIVMLETPALEWICEHACFWDLFYEHCNYFPRPTLAWLCRRVGFEVLAHDAGFGAQYQVLWLRRGARPSQREASNAVETIDLATSAIAMEDRRLGLERDLAAVDAARGWAIWGAGAKGVTLAHRMASSPRCLVDTNPAKQGGYIPGLATPIVGPEAAVVQEVGAVVIVNPNYADEIRADLHARDFAGGILIL
jgi:2-polyprenyl-3-methyl-5-hydroxy-6-metoxy-1,4-benzoquinol methylase